MSILKKDIYLQRKVVSLFYFVPMRSIKLGCFRLHSYSLWKALEEEGCNGLGFMVFGLEVYEVLEY